MLNVRNISIKNKLVWMQVITSVLVLGLCFVAFVIKDITGYKERKLSSMISIAQVIGSNSISAIQFMDNDAEIKTLANLQKVEKDIVTASILDTTGNIFANYTKEGNTAYKFTPPFTDRYDFNGGYLYVYKTIIKNNEPFGIVCLQVQLSELEQIKNQELKIAAVLLIIGITFAFLLSIITQTYITEPLLSLVNKMKEIRESEDYTRLVPIEGKDEITILSLEFNNLMNQIIQSNQKKDEFIGIASHELKTPLTGAKGYLELLNSMEIEQPIKSFVQKALNSTNKLQRLIYDLLDVSKIQAGQLQLDMKEFDIDTLINECIDEASVNLARHTIVKEDILIGQTIFADRNRIAQVIINLLSNALKYSAGAEKIIVNAVRSDSRIIISVKDFGIGLPKSEHQKIFDRFYRSKEGKSGVSGFGLGLYICAEIIKRHNGKIWVESVEGEGATFYFDIPISTNIE
ncbi:MAG TPA: ATP-binding protein [Ferruginibacter sp.]|jgi:signal transduction histidine kinase|nr:ATP-binding protein [Ferruginibacter sp.]